MRRSGHHDLRGGGEAGRRVLFGWRCAAWIQPARLHLRQALLLRSGFARDDPHSRLPEYQCRGAISHFQQEHPFDDQTHIVDRGLHRVHDPLRYGLTLGDGLTLAKLSLTSEASLDGQLIRDWFSQRFFDTEFWLLWSTEMGSLPQHTVIEFRRYLNRFVYLFPDLVEHGACLSLAIQPARGLRRTSGRLARRETGELREGRLCQRHRLYQVVWPHDGQSPPRRARQRLHPRSRSRLTTSCS